MKLHRIGVGMALMIGGLAGSAEAAPPWQSFVGFTQIEADPAKSYALTKDNGPWMIMAATFSGDDAQQDAQALVMELRRTHKLEAFTYEATFDFSEPLLGRGFDKRGNLKQMRHNRDDKIREVAVLVGGYDAVDSSAAQKVLERVKTMQLECLNSKTQEKADEYLRENSLADFLLVHRRLQSQKSQKGPLHLAFISPNPLLPTSYFRPNGVDKFVADMNADRRYNLLTNKARYTVKVATFNGHSVVDPKEIEKIENGAQMKSSLDKAADNAHRMTEALRAKGYEAYEFHDRVSSIVTVGGFMENPDGTLQNEAQAAELISRFAAKPVLNAQGVQTNGDSLPQSILGLPFDIEPKLIEVPRRSIASDYAADPR